jgi:hypothetical protein
MEFSLVFSFKTFSPIYIVLGHYATSRKVAASIPVVVIGFSSNFPNLSSRTTAREFTQPLTEISTVSPPGGQRGGG